MSDAKTPAEKPKPAARKPAAKKPAAVTPPPPPAAAVPAAPAAATTAPAAPAAPAATPPPPPGYAAAPPQQYLPPQPLRPDEERNIAMLSHLISLIAILLSASWISALIFYLIYKDRGPFVRAHTATELNFQLTMLLGIIAGALLAIILVGFLVMLAVPVLMIIFGIIATMKANAGEAYVYPLAIRFVQ